MSRRPLPKKVVIGVLLAAAGAAALALMIGPALWEASKKAERARAEAQADSLVPAYVREDIPALLSMSAAEGKQTELAEISKHIARRFEGSPDEAAYQALKTLGERAIPLLRRGTALRERLEVAEKFVSQGFLRPGDMELTAKELATVKEQNLSAEQEVLVNDLMRAARDLEGHRIGADTLFKAVGKGLAIQPPPGISTQPAPASSPSGSPRHERIVRMTQMIENFKKRQVTFIGAACYVNNQEVTTQEAIQRAELEAREAFRAMIREAATFIEAYGEGTLTELVESRFGNYDFEWKQSMKKSLVTWGRKYLVNGEQTFR